MFDLDQEPRSQRIARSSYRLAGLAWGFGGVGANMSFSSPAKHSTAHTLPSSAHADLSAQLLKLFEVARVHQLKSGSVLFDVGDAGDGCYWLDKGLLKVTVTSIDGERRIVAILGPGAVVGELAMINRVPRSASV